MTEYEPTRSGKKKFLRDVQPGKTYYSIEECAQPWGDEPMWREWEFKKTRLMGLMCGPHSPEYVLSNYGPLYNTKPRGLQGLFDRNSDEFPENVKAGWARRGKAGVR